MLSTFDERQYDPQVVHDHALDFDKSRFHRRILQFVEAKMGATRIQAQGWSVQPNEPVY